LSAVLEETEGPWSCAHRTTWKKQMHFISLMKSTQMWCWRMLHVKMSSVVC